MLGRIGEDCRIPTWAAGHGRNGGGGNAGRRSGRGAQARSGRVALEVPGRNPDRGGPCQARRAPKAIRRAGQPCGGNGSTQPPRQEAGLRSRCAGAPCTR